MRVVIHERDEREKEKEKEREFVGGGLMRSGGTQNSFFFLFFCTEITKYDEKIWILKNHVKKTKNNK